MPDGSSGNVIVLVVLMLLVIFAAYFTTRFLSSKAKNIIKGKYIRVKDRILLGRDKHILLLEVGDKAYLIGVTNQNINIIGIVDKDKIVPLADAQSASAVSGFKGLAGKFADFIKKAAKAQENLKDARGQYKNDKNGGKTNKEPDDIDKMMEALKNRNKKYSGGRRKGDEK